MTFGRTDQRRPILVIFWGAADCRLFAFVSTKEPLRMIALITLKFAQIETPPRRFDISEHQRG